MTNEEKDEVYALYRDGFEEYSHTTPQQEERDSVIYKPVINVEMCINCGEDHPGRNHNEEKYIAMFESLKARLTPLGYLVILNDSSTQSDHSKLGVVDFLNPFTNCRSCATRYCSILNSDNCFFAIGVLSN